MADQEKYPWLEKGVKSGWITLYEQEMLRFMEEEYGDLSETEKLCTVFSSLFVNAGHTMLPLDRTARAWGELLGIPDEDLELLPDRVIKPEELQNSQIVTESDGMKPLMLRGHNLAFRRYALYEKELLEKIEQKNSPGDNPFISSVQAGLLDQLFGKPAGQEPDWQKTAAALSLIKPFLIISGGPGTGKTTTVAKMLVLHQRLNGGRLNIALAAPTGKAAGRMGGALNQEIEKLGLNEEELSGIPREAKTVHRLLWPVREEGLLPPAEIKKLNYDLVIVDEASMVDLSLMHRLFTHLNEDTRLILLGDKYQLASVEAGAVFADLCRKPENGFAQKTISLLNQLGINGELLEYRGRPLDDSIVYLTKSYRFDEKSGIGALAKAVKASESEPEKVIERFDDLDHRPFTYTGNDLKQLTEHFDKRIRDSRLADTPGEMLKYWKKEAWFTVLRRGLAGSEKLNAIVERTSAANTAGRRHGWYHGRPVIITKNDYDLGVFNGDMGVCFRKEDEDIHFVYIESGADLKKIPADRLMHAEPAYFLTVHKSQGSEFEDVNLLLPNADTSILTRELLYTAVTRAKKRFTLHGNAELFKVGMNRRTERYTLLGT